MRPTGALVCLATLFIGSAAVRLGATQNDMMDAILDPADPVPPMIAASDPIPEAVALLQRLRARHKELDARELEIESRFATLTLIEKQTDEATRLLIEAEEKLASTMIRAETAAEDDLERLTSMYQEMKPEQASALFKQMEASFAAGFLARMRTDAAASILSGLDPEQAYSISVVLAGRHADVPDVTGKK